MRDRLLAWLTDRRRQAKTDDRGSVVDTVIIAAGVAALAISVVAAISLLVNESIAGISL